MNTLFRILLLVVILLPQIGWSRGLAERSWQTGDILITSHYWHPYSLAIQIVTESPVEHIGLVFIENEQPFVFEY